MNKMVAPLALIGILALISCSDKPTGVEANRDPATPENTSAPSPKEAGEAHQPPDDSRLQPPENIYGYFVIGLSSREQSDALQEMERRNRGGHRTRVAFSSEWPGLSPGWYIVLYGVFGSAAEATTAADELKSRGVEVYVKYSGTKVPGVTGAQPEIATSRRDEEKPHEVGTDKEAAFRKVGNPSEEAVGEVKKLWEQHFTRCGNSYVSLDSYNVIRQLNDVTFVISQHHRLTEADRNKGVEWSGVVDAKWDLRRVATKHDFGWVWGDWKASQQKHSFGIRKMVSEWNVPRASLYDRKKIECADLPEG